MKHLLSSATKLLLAIAVVIVASNVSFHYKSTQTENATPLPSNSSEQEAYPVGYRTKPGGPIPGPGRWEWQPDNTWKRTR